MARSEIYQQLSVQLSSCQYPIHIGWNCLEEQQLLQKFVMGKQLLIVTNETVAPLYLNKVRQAFTSWQCDTVILPDGEAYKNQQSLNAIYDALIQFKHHRDTTLLALGGGVIGDLTGFAAATYQRGVNLVQLPTTLLAQVDAAIGGKTAINHPLGKNLIGAFYQPHAVIIDLSTLKTLPERELRAGFAEIIKYGLLAGGDFLLKIQHILGEGLNGASRQEWSELISGCCQIKAKFVQEDERESGSRALLNLGHTFAHALEAYTSYERWHHGEAVAIGLFCAAQLSYEHGIIDYSCVKLVDALLAAAQLPRRIPKEIDLHVLHGLMFSDKKIKNQRLRFVLMKAPGNCYLDSTITDECLHHALMNAVEGD